MQAAGFAEVWEADVEEDVNRVLFALTQVSGQKRVSPEQQRARLAALAGAGRNHDAAHSGSSIPGSSGVSSPDIGPSSAPKSSGGSAAEIQETSAPCKSYGNFAAETAGRENKFEVPEEVLAHMGALKLLP